jgi:predicted ArsR family transcriptional regulator
MQQTRRHILEILKEQKEATIDEIVTELTGRIGKITAVTVRHHLEILRGDGLVAAPAVRRRSAPGRPQYVYTLTPQAADYFPNNYQGLASNLLGQMKNQLPPAQVNQILEGVANEMADQAVVPDAPIEVRLDHAIAYLKNNGYTAAWQHTDNGALVLSVTSCPYEQVSCNNPELCKMDERLIQNLVGVPAKRVSWQLDGDEACTYLIKAEK